MGAIAKIVSALMELIKLDYVVEFTKESITISHPRIRKPHERLDVIQRDTIAESINAFADRGFEILCEDPKYSHPGLHRCAEHSEFYCQLCGAK